MAPYVAMAIAGACDLGARRDEATFRTRIDAYCAAWSTGDADAPAKFYAKDNGLIFYDITPFAYHGWKEYHDGVQKAVFANMASGTLTAGKDLNVTRHGTVAWTSVTMHFAEKTRTGRPRTPTSATREYGRSAAQTGFSFTSTCPRL